MCASGGRNGKSSRILIVGMAMGEGRVGWLQAEEREYRSEATTPRRTCLGRTKKTTKKANKRACVHSLLAGFFVLVRFLTYSRFGFSVLGLV